MKSRKGSWKKKCITTNLSRPYSKRKALQWTNLVFLEFILLGFVLLGFVILGFILLKGLTYIALEFIANFSIKIFISPLQKSVLDDKIVCRPLHKLYHHLDFVVIAELELWLYDFDSFYYFLFVKPQPNIYHIDTDR